MYRDLHLLVLCRACLLYTFAQRSYYICLTIASFAAAEPRRTSKRLMFYTLHSQIIWYTTSKSILVILYFGKPCQPFHLHCAFAFCLPSPLPVQTHHIVPDTQFRSQTKKALPPQLKLTELRERAPTRSGPQHLRCMFCALSSWQPLLSFATQRGHTGTIIAGRGAAVRGVSEVSRTCLTNFTYQSCSVCPCWKQTLSANRTLSQNTIIMNQQLGRRVVVSDANCVGFL